MRKPTEKQLQELAKEEVRDFNYRLRTNKKHHKQGYEDCKQAILNDLRQIIKDSRIKQDGSHDFRLIAEGLLVYILKRNETHL